jgi:hypothetical protein
MTDPADPTPVVSGDTTNLRRRRAGTASPRMVLLVTSAAAFLSSLDLFIVNIAFPAIRADLAGTDLGDLSWVLNGYTVVFAAFLPLSGRLAGRGLDPPPLPIEFFNDPAQTPDCPQQSPPTDHENQA